MWVKKRGPGPWLKTRSVSEYDPLQLKAQKLLVMLSYHMNFAHGCLLRVWLPEGIDKQMRKQAEGIDKQRREQTERTPTTWLSKVWIPEGVDKQRRKRTKGIDKQRRKQTDACLCGLKKGPGAMAQDTQ